MKFDMNLYLNNYEVSSLSKCPNPRQTRGKTRPVTKKPPEECSVCCDEEVSVTCPKCAYKICNSCMRRYTLDNALQPKCMNCSMPHDRAFLMRQIGANFVNKDLKEKKEESLFELERSLFPQTQEEEIFIQMRYRANYDSGMKKAREDPDYIRLTEEQKVLAAKMFKLQQKLNKIYSDIAAVQEKYNGLNPYMNRPKDEEKKVKARTSVLWTSVQDT